MGALDLIFIMTFMMVLLMWMWSGRCVKHGDGETAGFRSEGESSNFPLSISIAKPISNLPIIL